MEMGVGEVLAWLLKEDELEPVRVLVLLGMGVIVWLLKGIKREQSDQNVELKTVNESLHSIDLRFAHLDGKLVSFDAWKLAHDKQDDERETVTRNKFDALEANLREIRRQLHAFPER